MPEKPNDAMDEMDDLGLEMTSSERMRRMKTLMRQLYQEEASVHKVTIPPIRSKLLIMIASLGAMAILIASTFYNFNRFIAAEEQVLSSRGHIHDALQRRSNLFGNLVNLTLNHAMLEQEVFRYVSDGRIALMGSNPLANAASAGTPSAGANPSPSVPTVPGEGLPPAEALARLFGLVEQYPDIKTSTTYQQLMDKLVDIENLISTRRDEYNTEVKFYNTMITSFPWWVMAKIMGFKRYPYFTAQEGPDNMNMELNANKFMRLVPENEFGKMQHKEHQLIKENPVPAHQAPSGVTSPKEKAAEEGVPEVNGHQPEAQPPVDSKGGPPSHSVEEANP
ncbi:MAG: LemA family protein [Magnetococcales bacterium]|nr:LemA family protein [Magnetococcales bacterium]